MNPVLQYRKICEKITKKPYATLLIAGFLFWVLETWAFGFNYKPGSPLESVCDFASTIMMAWGFLGDLASELYVIKINSPYPVSNKTVMDLRGLGNVKKFTSKLKSHEAGVLKKQL